MVIWLTGIPSSGKTTIAKALVEKLGSVAFLDGDTIRDSPISEGLGFSWRDRERHIQRVGFIANLLSPYTTVVCAFISPSARVREELKASIPGFLEVYCCCPKEIASERDVKGLYAKAKAGELYNLTGWDAPYQAPEHPDVWLNTHQLTVDECVEKILQKVDRNV